MHDGPQHNSLVHPRVVLAADNELVHLEPIIQDLLAVDEVIFTRPLVCVGFVLGDTGLDMAPDEAFAGDVKVDIDEPRLVHESGGMVPRRLVEGNVESLKDENSMGRFDGDVVLFGVFDSVVEAGGMDCPR